MVINVRKLQLHSHTRLRFLRSVVYKILDNTVISKTQHRTCRVYLLADTTALLTVGGRSKGDGISGISGMLEFEECRWVEQLLLPVKVSSLPSLPVAAFDVVSWPGKGVAEFEDAIGFHQRQSGNLPRNKPFFVTAFISHAEIVLQVQSVGIFQENVEIQYSWNSFCPPFCNRFP